MRPLTARERRLSAIAILIVLVAMVVFIVVAPLIAGFAARAEQRELLRATFQRNAELIQVLPALQRRAEAQKSELRRFALTVPNQSRASDQLRERLRGEFSAVGGEVSAVQDVAAPAPLARAWVGGRLTLDQLVALLTRMQNNTPYLVVESMRISADRALESGRLDQLDVRIEASIPYTLASS